MRLPRKKIGILGRELRYGVPIANPIGQRVPEGFYGSDGEEITCGRNREIIAIERNFEKLTGNKPRFTFEKNPDGNGAQATPMFEDFAKTNKLVEYNGEKFYLYGAPDGLMHYVTDEGEVIRVGLEIKSKQQSPSKTSAKSLRRADFAHEAQTALYAYMYDCDYYVILYVNGAKRAWDMSAEEYADFPDIRAFCRRITDADRAPLFDKFAGITKALREKKPDAEKQSSASRE